MMEARSEGEEQGIGNASRSSEERGPEYHRYYFPGSTVVSLLKAKRADSDTTRKTAAPIAALSRLLERKIVGETEEYAG
jgi:hypothetical protein